MKLAQTGDATSRPEILPGLVFEAAGLTFLGIALLKAVQSVVLLRLSYELAGVLLLVGSGFLSTYFTAKARARGPLEQALFVRRGARPLRAPFKQIRNGYDRLYAKLANTDWGGDWLPLLIVALGAVVALVALAKGWALLAAPPPGARIDEWVGGMLIGVTFPTLVLERRFAVMPAHVTADAPALTKLLRLLLLNLMGFCLVYLLFWLDLPWAVPAEQAVILFTGLVAAELLLRAAGYLFMPLAPLESRRSHADSLAAGLIRLERPSLSAMGAAVNRQFGIDLGRSWALGFIRRAFFPLLMALAFAGWLLTGVTALNVNQRAVYEAFGRPQAVLHSGLHVHLPWPFGILRLVEYGEVHEIPIVVQSQNAATAEAEPAGPPSSIEGEPPPSADRLWDASHPSEASYLVADNSNGQESFEIVNIDLRILYRIGLSDTAAYDALYGLESPEALIRAVTGRMLALHFARYTISDVLGQNREAFIRGFQTELQSRLNEMKSGVDILSVVVEAIHPPPDAATAYQNVQAAAVRSVTQIAIARGNATQEIKQAQTGSERKRAEAAASSAETIDRAKTNTTLFLADVDADHRDGAAFLFERRLEAMSAALQPDVPVTIIDSRIPETAMPILDLRPPGSASILPETDSDN